MSLHILTVLDYVGLPARPNRRTNRWEPLYRGGGRDYLVCGGCCFPVAMAINRKALRSHAIICPECGAVNEAR